MGDLGWCWVLNFRVATDSRPEVKHRPILFQGPMVRAILAGRKTQTRRPVKQAIPEDADEVFFWTPGETVATTMPHVAPSGLWVRRNDGEEGEDGWVRHLGSSPYGQVGDRLWVRETWAWNPEMEEADRAESVGRPRSPSGRWAWYRATDGEIDGPHGGSPWRSGRFMPRWASRLTLEIESVRVERVEDISEVDARAEGFQGGPGGTYYAVEADGEPYATARAAYLGLWRSIHNGRKR